MKKTIIATGLLLILALIAILPPALYHNRLFPHTYVNAIDIGNKTPEEAKEILRNSVSITDSLELTYNDRSFQIPIKELEFAYEIDETIHIIRTKQTGSNLYKRFINSWNGLTKQQNSPFTVSLNQVLLGEHLSIIADELSVGAIEPALRMENDSVVYKPGTIGTDINVAHLHSKILDKLSLEDHSPLEITLVTIDTTISDEEAEVFLARGKSIADKSIALEADHYTLSLQDNDILSLLSYSSKYNTTAIDNVILNISYDLDREPVNPVFNYENGKVIEFSAPRDGLEIKKDLLKEKIIYSLQILESTDETAGTILLPLTKASPSVTMDEVNNLGINELIGYGESKFVGSIASRIHNVGLGSSKFNGILIAPDEEFSFNKTIGDISALTGYKQSYIIQDGKTVLGDGGGVCQVSTTFFRAALDAGLGITERRSHSYRVTYYEQDAPPGLDATIYSPTTDLKVKNNTGQHLLIQTLFDPNQQTLIFEIYGTYDGREVKLTDPTISSQSPPPEPFYQDDPTLTEGTTKQIDWAAWGARVSFDYEVTKNGEIIEDQTFYSNYRPWQAKYLRGIGPAI